MEKLYVITCVFRAANHDYQLFWLPDRYCFTYGEPRSIIPEAETRNALVEAESHARSTLGVSGMNVPFVLRRVEVTFQGGRILGATPAAKEWVRA
jgi:hypothetical protein